MASTTLASDEGKRERGEKKTMKGKKKASALDPFYYLSR
jgi:hypothetical protein